MNEANYLVFFLNNRLSERYSIYELKNEIKDRLKELGFINQEGKIDEAKLNESEMPERPEVYIERAAPLTKEGIRAICGTDEEYNEFVKIKDGEEKDED